MGLFDTPEAPPPPAETPSTEPDLDALARLRAEEERIRRGRNSLIINPRQPADTGLSIPR